MGMQKPDRDLERRIQELEQQVNASLTFKKAFVDLEEKYKVLVENANDAIFVLQNNKVKFANPKSLEIAGIVAAELEQKNYTDFLHPDEKEKVVQRHQKRLKGEKVLSMYPLRLINKDGDVIWVEVNAVRIDWEGQPATLNIIRDITSQKLGEVSFSQANHLTSVRTLAGGLAHELNNLLTGIQGRASLLSMALGKSDPLHAHIEEMERLINEAAKLSRQLVGFAQSGKYRLEKINLNQLAEQALASLNNRTKPIDIRKDYDEHLWPVEADPSQLDQVLMNVLVNAWQAIADKGCITIKTENMMLQEGRTPGHSIQPGPYVKISIKDTGIGMDDGIRKRVFEPFFTTKAVGRHRGLGLSSVYGIVVNHSGLVDVASAPGQGSTFSILLPAALEENNS